MEMNAANLRIVGRVCRGVARSASDVECSIGVRSPVAERLAPLILHDGGSWGSAGVWGIFGQWRQFVNVVVLLAVGVVGDGGADAFGIGERIGAIGR